MAAATRVIVTQGLRRADSDRLLKRAAVSNGSLFTYFETKAELVQPTLC